ncbi:MAG: hydroxylamine oxidoreductase [Gammaproteobacteria bacterium]|nr:hydroxylamine oxidoreductase [Gammaproteobacteria bacterium]
MGTRYVYIPLLILLILIPAGRYYVSWSKSGSGAGLYSHEWQPEAIQGYWHPKAFYTSVKSIVGEYTGEECVSCHEAVTPGIVSDWRQSGHSQPANNQGKVYCSSCHGNDHQNLHLPTPEICGGCHTNQHDQFLDERRFGFPSHALAMERAIDAKHFVDKPKSEVTACLQCHSVASKCDSCHTRHRFSAAEARRPEACITCHSGPPHPDDATYFASAHGQRYLKDGDNWDWSKPLSKGNYEVPTCAYCHMSDGKHQVADKPIWKFGIKQVNPLSSGNEIKRQQWIALCSDCHEADWSADRLREMDAERKQAWAKLYEAEAILKSLRSDSLLHPAAGERPPYPNDWLDSLFPREHIGFLEGQASAFYNVSPIERDYFEMWYFDNLGAYKGAAHGASSFVEKGHAGMEQALSKIKAEAKTLRMLGESEQRKTGKRSAPGEHWLKGEYTEFNKEHN